MARNVPACRTLKTSSLRLFADFLLDVFMHRFPVLNSKNPDLAFPYLVDHAVVSYTKLPVAFDGLCEGERRTDLAIA